jgi:hypothetical protein
MDAQRFDRIARTFAVRASRRWLLRALAALGLGSGVLGPSRAGARRAPGGADGSGTTIEATDPICKDQRAITNKVCPTSPCGNGCLCAESVHGSKKCAFFGAVQCPTVDECDRNSDCSPGLVCFKVAGCCHSRKNLCLPPVPKGCPPSDVIARCGR